MDTNKLLTTKDSLLALSPLILVVEDDADNQLLLKYTIAMFGWEYIFAMNAIDAITIAKEKSPDLILLDIVMPDFDGFQAANLLKNHNQTQNIPLIAVTGLIGKEEQKLIFSSGFDRYVSKPYALDDLRQAIVSILDNTNKFCRL